MTTSHKNQPLARCLLCGTPATEDEGPEYVHREDWYGRYVIVECECGAMSAPCATMDEAWESWERKNR